MDIMLKLSKHLVKLSLQIFTHFTSNSLVGNLIYEYVRLKDFLKLKKIFIIIPIIVYLWDLMGKCFWIDATEYFSIYKANFKLQKFNDYESTCFLHSMTSFQLTRYRIFIQIDSAFNFLS